MSDEKNQPNQGGSETGAASAAVSGASEIIKRKRGRPAGSGSGASQGTGGSAGISGASSELAQRQAELQAQFDRLYDPVVWEGIVAAPANIALAFTGNKVWDLPQNEVKTLSVQASVTARCFAVSDPKYLALTMLAISIITIYGGRTMQYFSEKAEAKEAAGNPAPKG